MHAHTYALHMHTEAHACAHTRAYVVERADSSVLQAMFARPLHEIGQMVDAAVADPETFGDYDFTIILFVFFSSFFSMFL